MMSLLVEVIQYVIHEQSVMETVSDMMESKLEMEMEFLKCFVTQYSFCRSQSPVNHFAMKLILDAAVRLHGMQ